LSRDDTNNLMGKFQDNNIDLIESDNDEKTYANDLLAGFENNDLMGKTTDIMGSNNNYGTIVTTESDQMKKNISSDNDFFDSYVNNYNPSLSVNQSKESPKYDFSNLDPKPSVFIEPEIEIISTPVHLEESPDEVW